MPRHREPLNRGLVTVRDPALLEPGELAGLQNLVYLPGDPALRRARGRAVYGTVSATATDVVGLRDVTFDNGDRYLIAHASASYLTATAGDVGTFGVMVTGVGVGTQLEVVHYRNRFFLFNGVTAAATATAVNSNRVIYLSATATTTAPTVRQHGMVPVQDQARVTTAAGTFSQTVTGYYEYWTTEVAHVTQDGADFSIESTFVGQPNTVFVSSTGQVPTISQPAIVNTAVTTHWRIYRSPKKDKATDKKFPSGFAITSEVSIAATGVSDTTTTSDTGFIFPGNQNGNGDGATVYANFANASALVSDNDVDSTAVSSGPLNTLFQGVYGFNFGGFTGSVKGVEIVVEALVNSGSAPVGVIVVKRRQADGGIIPVITSDILRGPLGETYARLNSARKSFVATTVRTAYTLGGPTDRWFASDNPSSFADSDFGTSFMVVLYFSSPSGARTLSVDYVKVKVYYASTIDSVIPFPTVVYTFGDVSAQVGKNGPPPSSSTGDLYEDTLVVNDVSNPGLIRYSYPGDPEAFPATYYLDFETRENDRVTLVKTVNDRLIVGLSTSLWRVNYLPSERDASFDRGKAIQPISRQFGVVNEMCACVFTREGGTEELAIVSQKGIHTTDGFNFTTRASQLDWRNHLSLTSTSTAIALINDAENLRLLFYYRNDTTTESYLCLHLSYAAGDMDREGNFKVSGPVNMRNFDSATSSRANLNSAWAVPRSNGDTSIYLGYGASAVGATSTAAGAGKVYLDTGTTIPAQDSSCGFVTRRMYLADLSNEWRLGEVYGYCGSYNGTPLVTYTVLNTKTNDAGETAGASKAVTLGGQRLHRTQFSVACEGARVSAVVSASAFSQEFLVLDGEGWGREDSGR